MGNIIGRIVKKIQFFGDESSLHGVRKVCSMNSIPVMKRLFWLAILICCGLGAAAILRSALRVYSGNLISFTVETDYLTWDTPYPTVTICETLDPNNLKDYMAKNKVNSSLKSFLGEMAYWQLKFCRTCSSCKIGISCTDDFYHYVEGIRRNCSQLMSKCWFENKPFNCCERFQPIMTEYGTCFSFNSMLSANHSPLITVNKKVGLPTLVFTTTNEVQLSIHASDDTPSSAMEQVVDRKYLDISNITDFELSLKAEETNSDICVTSLPRKMRGCLFSYEKPDGATHWPFDQYNYNSCLLYCKAIAEMSLCNCTHHLMPKIDPFPICKIEGLRCLYKNSLKLRNSDCDCPVGCKETIYEPVHLRFNRTLSPSKALQRRGSQITIRLAYLPSLRVRRQCIRDTLGLVVDIGGVGGVFFGASLLSVLEIVYLFLIRK